MFPKTLAGATLIAGLLVSHANAQLVNPPTFAPDLFGVFYADSVSGCGTDCSPTYYTDQIRGNSYQVTAYYPDTEYINRILEEQQENFVQCFPNGLESLDGFEAALTEAAFTDGSQQIRDLLAAALAAHATTGFGIAVSCGTHPCDDCTPTGVQKTTHESNYIFRIETEYTLPFSGDCEGPITVTYETEVHVLVRGTWLESFCE